MIKKLFLVTLLAIPTISFADSDILPYSNIYHQKGIIRSVENQPIQNPSGTVQQTQVEIIAGPDAGQRVNIMNSFFGGLREFLVSKGDKVLIYSEDDNREIIHSIRDHWRLDGIIFWALLFIVATYGIARWKGLKGILALLLSILIIFRFFIPAVAAGRDPLLCTLVISVFIILINVPLIHGWNRKTLSISISTTIAIALTIILTLIIDHFLKIHGTGAEETIYLQNGLQNYHSLPKLFAAGVVLGALGAVMDVCVSIASGLYEIINHKKMSFQKLFRSGMNIGGDVLGSMLNTLVFAYVGASLVMLIVITQGDFALLPLLNFSFITEEIIRSLIGAFGLLLAIPITALVGSLLLHHPDENTL